MMETYWGLLALVLSVVWALLRALTPSKAQEGFDLAARGAVLVDTTPSEGEWYYDKRARIYRNETTGENVPSEAVEDGAFMIHMDTTRGLREETVYDMRPKYTCAHCRTAWNADSKGDCKGCGSSFKLRNDRPIPAAPTPIEQVSIRR